MSFLFENLEVYQRSIALSEKIHGLTESFPKGSYYLTDQFNRACLSIPTNIAEGNGRFHKADRINFFRIARGSAFECIPIIEICKRRGFISEQEYISIKNELDEIGKMISGLINY